MTPLWIAIVFLALGLALLAARLLALREGEGSGGLSLGAAGGAQEGAVDALAVHASARRESGRRKLPSPFTRPSDLFPPKAQAPAPKKAPATPTPTLEELLARCPEIGSEEDASRSDSSEELAAALPPEPELTPEQRERIARLMSAVKAEFGTILADEKRRAKDAETEGP